MVNFKMIFITLAIAVFIRNIDASKYTKRVHDLNTI